MDDFVKRSPPKIPVSKKPANRPLEKSPQSVKISEALLAMARTKAMPRGLINPQQGRGVFGPALHPPSATPSNAMAMDEFGGALSWAESSYGYGEESGVQSAFLGYPQLALLSLRPEFRRMAEILAQEMTRKWIKLQSAGDEDKTGKIKKLNNALDALKVQARFKAAAEQDAYFGRAHIYLDFGVTDDLDELKTPIGDGKNAISQAKVKQFSLQALRNIEALWAYPTNYNATDPLKDNWYRPDAWLVQGKQVHASRILTFVARPVPDLMKPAMSFGGLSLTQIAKPYVDSWIKTRTGVGDLISAFSVFVLSTSMAEASMNENALFRRADFFNQMRDNRGVFMIDKETETFGNVSASLAGLEGLQAQSQEHQASVCGIPIVKLFGTQPTGLNASGDSEMECFNTWVHSQQVSTFKEPLTTLINFLQLSLFGEIDPDINFIFEPLGELNEKEQAEIQKIEAETGEVLKRSGTISTHEERTRIAADPNTAYTSLEVGALPKLSPTDAADVAVKTTTAIIDAFSAGLTGQASALTELKQMSTITGLFADITPEDVQQAALEPPKPPMEGMPGMLPGSGAPAGGSQPSGNGGAGFAQPDPGAPWP